MFEGVVKGVVAPHFGIDLAVDEEDEGREGEKKSVEGRESEGEWKVGEERFGWGCFGRGEVRGGW